MKIVCAESVTCGKEAFETLGEVQILPDAIISNSDLNGADALVTRSKTKIDADLVADTNLQFVGTATAGYDHIDADALEDAGIYWTASPGCNAVSVAEYIIAALLEIGRREQFCLAGKSIAVIGVGEVGSRVANRARALGMKVLLNDPPRAEREGDSEFRELHKILPQADIVTLHSPLARNGKHPTLHLFDEERFAETKAGCVFLNASRGEVVDEEALLTAMDSGIVSDAVLDVWDNEPYCRRELLEGVDIATPHIAGYSFDGKMRGTEMVYRQLCTHFGLSPIWNSNKHLPPSPLPEIVVDIQEQPREEVLRSIIQRIYDIHRDDRALRPDPLPPREQHAQLFKRLRKEYPIRREFSGTRVKLDPADKEMQAIFSGLGFS